MHIPTIPSPDSEGSRLIWALPTIQVNTHKSNHHQRHSGFFGLVYGSDLLFWINDVLLQHNYHGISLPEKDRNPCNYPQALLWFVDSGLLFSDCHPKIKTGMTFMVVYSQNQLLVIDRCSWHIR
jgi:hypothetical protein